MHKPFAGKKIYYSGSIKGSPELDPYFAGKLVAYLIEHGAEVLTEHIAAPTPAEMRRIFATKTGQDVYEHFDGPRAAMIIRRQDMQWVDEATHLVALVNAPSHGVGMEIERALLKPARGLPRTPILCLVHVDMHDRLSSMIKGITAEECDVFCLKTYSTLEEACAIMSDFLQQ